MDALLSPTPHKLKLSLKPFQSLGDEVFARDFPALLATQ